MSPSRVKQSSRRWKKARSAAGWVEEASVVLFLFLGFGFLRWGERCLRWPARLALFSFEERETRRVPLQKGEGVQRTVSVRQPPVHLLEGKELLVVQAHLLAHGQGRQLRRELLEPLRVGERRRLLLLLGLVLLLVLGGCGRVVLVHGLAAGLLVEARLLGLCCFEGVVLASGRGVSVVGVGSVGVASVASVGAFGFWFCFVSAPRLGCASCKCAHGQGPLNAPGVMFAEEGSIDRSRLRLKRGRRARGSSSCSPLSVFSLSACVALLAGAGSQAVDVCACD